MLSFINEIDDPIVQKDILDLNLRASRDQIRLGTEEFKGVNFAAFLTWMIPTDLGAFVQSF